MNGQIERRSGIDRREQGFGKLGSIFYYRRRRFVRRACDRRKIVLLDKYSGSILAMMGVVLLLSLTDAWFTLILIDHGAVELNPVMDFYLKLGPAAFVWVKYMLTAVSVSLIVAFNYVLIPSIKIVLGDLLKLFAGGFAAVISWEVFLLIHFVV